MCKAALVALVISAFHAGCACALTRAARVKRSAHVRTTHAEPQRWVRCWKKEQKLFDLHRGTKKFGLSVNSDDVRKFWTCAGTQTQCEAVLTPEGANIDATRAGVTCDFPVKMRSRGNRRRSPRSPHPNIDFQTTRKAFHVGCVTRGVTASLTEGHVRPEGGGRLRNGCPRALLSSVQQFLLFEWWETPPPTHTHTLMFHPPLSLNERTQRVTPAV